MSDTRTIRTPEERLAAAKAEIAELEARVEARNAKRAGQLQEQRAKLIDQISERETKVAAIEAELDELGAEYSSVSLGVADDTEQSLLEAAGGGVATEDLRV